MSTFLYNDLSRIWCQFNGAHFQDQSAVVVTPGDHQNGSLDVRPVKGDVPVQNDIERCLVGGWIVVRPALELTTWSSVDSNSVTS